MKWERAWGPLWQELAKAARATEKTMSSCWVERADWMVGRPAGLDLTRSWASSRKKERARGRDWETRRVCCLARFSRLPSNW